MSPQSSGTEAARVRFVFSKRPVFPVSAWKNWKFTSIIVCKVYTRAKYEQKHMQVSRNCPEALVNVTLTLI